MTEQLKTIDVQTLLSTPMESLRFVVSGLIPTGLRLELDNDTHLEIIF